MPQHVLPTTPQASRADRHAEGKARRQAVPRRHHATFTPSPDRPDPLQVLRANDRSVLPHLLALRYGRLSASPFAFYRGTAGLMAFDLSGTPTTGWPVQASGDAHCANFGAFATAERNLVFDLNDFDETHPAPWEWDVKRLAASLVLAARAAGHSEADARHAALSAARAYRLHTRTYADMTHLDIWYDRIDAHEALADTAHDAFTDAMFRTARKRTGQHALARFATRGPDGRWRVRDEPPLLTHPNDPDAEAWVEEVRLGYFESVPEDRRVLLARYHLTDWALKVTGVGSAGRRVLVLLLLADDGQNPDDVLFLQVKEARASVLEPFTAPCGARNAAHRIVRGQRLMQAAGDPFLGWATRGDHAFYVRQLRDMKGSFELEGVSPRGLEEYAELCAWALARAHARTGDAVRVGGYLGKGEGFEASVAAFAVTYADVAERDHARLLAAIRTGEILAEQDAGSPA
ncbi:DUF2252 domain-containing protein [Deinococcus maricopensis]|uniref:DUF2252 domain-containing protein n=1 Tax=Deinococcus maricopensis (strain DSM 21211 / LMG 22137 / NRRL B-23946 / LB-34) TaxID=709986 RepID=E8U510_DEIML|nr:DUF2252 domain-containing protein [Deinococcus maricopensis]ADV66149.1 Protein of unknown function DUF2252 [Deinococcus maricopensis DSM 21211]